MPILPPQIPCAERIFLNLYEHHAPPHLSVPITLPISHSPPMSASTQEPGRFHLHTRAQPPNNQASSPESVAHRVLSPSPSISAIVAAHERMVSRVDASLRQHGHVARIDRFPRRVGRLVAHVCGVARERHGLQPGEHGRLGWLSSE